MPAFDNTSDTLLKNLVDLITIKYVDHSYDDALDCAIFIRLITKNDANVNRSNAALTCIHDCSGALLGSKSVADGKGEQANITCPICGQQPPLVRLGAGPGVFICNECVDTFSTLFARQKK